MDLTAPTWKVLRDAVTDAIDLDGRVLRTVRAIVSPGRITVEFLRGRRTPYAGPVKLFFIAGAALSTTWLLTRGVDARYYGLPNQGSAGAYIDTVVRGLLASSVTIAVVSWLLSLRRRRFLDEGVFALHVVAALSLWAAVVIWIGTVWKLVWGSVVGVPPGVPSLVNLVFLPAGLVGLGYVATALRVVHGLPWWAAAVRALLLAVVALAVVLMMIVRSPIF